MKNLYKIGEVSKLCDVSIKALRYYEKFGLINPSKIDKFTGYRFYDNENIKTLKKITFLKNLNFSLKEIKYFNENSLINKKKEMKQKIKELRGKINQISSLQIKNGDIIMKEFINDEEAIGKWEYKFSAKTKENYFNDEYYYDKNAMLQELYFLPNGEGYYIFNGWSKGKLYLNRGYIYKYEIIDGKLFLNIINDDSNSITLIYKKVDSKKYTINEIQRKDFVDYPFELDNNILGKWQVVDFVDFDKINDYIPINSKRKLYLQELNFMQNGVVLLRDKYGNEFDKNWTKNHILTNIVDEHYQIKNIDNQTYLFFEWKSGDYIFAGKIYGYYCFKKIDE